MNAPRAKPIPSVINEVRRLSHLLAVIGDRIHAELGLTTAMRELLVSLAETGPSTVADVGRTRGVSRQNIQILVNRMEKQGLITLTDNPRHRRSPLVELTDNGMAALRSVEAREAPLGAELAKALTADEASQVVAALQALRNRLEASAPRA
jgi:DNA-binding MarR family transcriptional regulator